MAAHARPLSALRGAGRMAAWRAHAYGGAAELRLDSARVPPLRAPDDVLVRVAAASINPLDVAMLDGYGSRLLNVLRSAEGAEGVEFPLVCGRDFVGTVVRAGPAARLRAGQRAWGVLPPHRPGAHADYVLVRDRWAGEAPAALDDASAGGALYAALSASAALRVGGVWGRGARGARVLLLGLGGVGHAALQLLGAGGARVRRDPGLRGPRRRGGGRATLAVLALRDAQLAAAAGHRLPGAGPRRRRRRRLAAGAERRRRARRRWRLPAARALGLLHAQRGRHRDHQEAGGAGQVQRAGGARVPVVGGARGVRARGAGRGARQAAARLRRGAPALAAARRHHCARSFTCTRPLRY